MESNILVNTLIYRLSTFMTCKKCPSIINLFYIFKDYYTY